MSWCNPSRFAYGTPRPSTGANATWGSGGKLDQRLSRLYPPGLFGSGGSRLEQGDLTVLLRARSGGRFGLGLRYDSRYKASVLLSSTLGRIAGGFSGRADVRLGQQI